MASEGRTVRRRAQMLAALVVLLCASGVLQVVGGRRAARAAKQAAALARGGGSAEAAERLRGRQGAASRLQWAGLWCTVAAAGVGGVLLAGVASAAVQAALGPVRLEDDLAELAARAVFQTRMELLSRSALPAGDARWELRLHRVLSDHDTHTVFEATARRGEEAVLLWGKRYKVTGWLKSLQRLFLPAYESATWGILCRMHTSGLGGPVPVAFDRLRRGGLRVGSILVAEHVGSVVSVKGFLRSGFAVRPAAWRQAFLAALGAFVRRLHEAGICDFTARYLYAKGLDGPVGSVTLYLFDLDKARLAVRAPRWVRRARRRRDVRRLVDCVREVATPEELAAFEAAARGAEAQAS